MNEPYVLVRFEDDTLAIFEGRPGNAEGEMQYHCVVTAAGEMHSLQVLRDKVSGIAAAMNNGPEVSFEAIKPFLQAE